MTPTAASTPSLDDIRRILPRLEIVRDVVDQCLDIMLNLRQSGHPGGSRSKAPALVFTLLSGAMRWDARNPVKRFADRFVLVAGHTNPMVYAALAVLNDALRTRYRETGDPRFRHAHGDDRVLLPEDLLRLRRRGGLPGHAEMEGKTLFFKFCTGPSGHGSPAAAGQALALRMAGADDVKVFAFEGEGGHTAGVTHETKNSAFGLGLHNLVYVLDWNDWGIDDNPVSSVVHGTPDDWFRPYGFKVAGAEDGGDFGSLARAFHEVIWGENPERRPRCIWMKTRKGRGYLVHDNKSHGTPHKQNSELYWQTKKVFADRYGVTFEGMGTPAPKDPAEARRQAEVNLDRVLDVIRRDRATLEFVTDTLVRLGDSVPDRIEGCRVDGRSDPLADPVYTDARSYPPELFAAPGAREPNRKGLGLFGAFVNSVAARRLGRPLFVACSADLAESTNLAGFAKGFGDFPGFGWYNRDGKTLGSLLPQQITEFANAGILTGLATVNFADDAERYFSGFLGACSTYGSFSYLKYGAFRLFSQLAQDCQLRVGKILWVAGHSGPETAEDSRTHFGIFAPGVTQLFPRTRIINIRPWDMNEVPVLIAAALREDVPVIALHLTRPPIEVPDRAALGIPSWFEAARGAYVMRPFDPARPRGGVVIVEGAGTTAGLAELLKSGDLDRLNVKVVAAPSSELFARQPAAYRESVLPEAEWLDSTVVSNGSRKLMHDWIHNRIAEEYAMTADWDDRWRTGGTVDEILDEAHLSPAWLLRGIERFVTDRPERLRRFRALLDGADAGADR